MKAARELRYCLKPTKAKLCTSCKAINFKVAALFSMVKQIAENKELIRGDHKTSCGHVIKSSGLKEWCKALLDEGGFTFNCPKCAKEWPWQEVRKIAQLTQDECKSFEEQLNRIMKPRAESYKKCPNCRLYVQRMDPEKLCVQCLPCSEKSNKTIRFCWGCLREWKNPDAQIQHQPAQDPAEEILR
ncbi:hypothetical protein chiPu_0004888 [Chiloscyllium punctatum]|uniref:RING-type domain-containing protein n=1 Tax=Chiloscyllium punctatum TaxID=137246 RepID=A0A401S7W2_CHIPU|nr:hypothetical protein [Chiloscyllium punctatum]